MVFGCLVDTMAPLTFLVAFGAVVFDVSLHIFPWHSSFLTDCASDGFERAPAQMSIELVGRKRHDLTVVGALHGALRTTLSDVRKDL